MRHPLDVVVLKRDEDSPVQGALCDKALVLLYKDGQGSVTSVDGRTEQPLPAKELFTLWLLLGEYIGKQCEEGSDEKVLISTLMLKYALDQRQRALPPEQRNNGL